MNEPEIRICPGPVPNPARPSFTVPEGAIDMHLHVFGPTARYPDSPERGYTPPDASLDSLFRLYEVPRVERAVRRKILFDNPRRLYGLD